MQRVRTLLMLAAASAPATAHAQFAEPPDDAALVVQDHRSREPLPEPQPYDAPHSSVRLFTGPALRISDEASDGGLQVAIDIGARAAGGRLSGTWIRAGSDGGLSEYAAQIWIDFSDGGPLHPILGAGAGIARIDQVDAAGDHSAETLGVGLLRGTLQYALPVRGVDARAGLDVVGSVPAVGEPAEGMTPWLTLAAHVGVGF
jgi:hypothetical protein